METSENRAFIFMFLTPMASHLVGTSKSKECDWERARAKEREREWAMETQDSVRSHERAHKLLNLPMQAQDCVQ